MKTRFHILLFLNLVLCANAQLSNQADQMSDVGTLGKFWAAACSNGEYALAGGGRDGFFGDAQADFHLYHIPTDTWTDIPDYPLGAREGMIAFSIDGRLFVGMGSPFIQWTNDLHEFDLNTMSWVQMSSSPGVMAFADAYVLNGKAYIMPMYVGNDAFVMAYEAATNTWENVMPYNSLEMAQYPIGFAVNDKIYFGSGGTAFGNPPYTRWYEFDPTGPSITEKNPLPVGTDQSTAFAIGNTGYMYNVGGNSFTMYRYDAQNDSWDNMGLFPDHRIANACSFADDTYGYVLYGEVTGSGENTPVNEVWRFTPIDESVSVADLSSSPARMWLDENNVLFVANHSGTQGRLEVYGLNGERLLEKSVELNTEITRIPLNLNHKGVCLFRLESDIQEVISIKGLLR